MSSRHILPFDTAQSAEKETNGWTDMGLFGEFPDPNSLAEFERFLAPHPRFPREKTQWPT